MRKNCEQSAQNAKHKCQVIYLSKVFGTTNIFWQTYGIGGLIMREFHRCKFCERYSEVYGCPIEELCEKYNRFLVDESKIFEKASEYEISVADVIALMKVED